VGDAKHADSQFDTALEHDRFKTYTALYITTSQ